VLTLPPFKEIAEAIQATMAQAGVEVEILPGDGGQVYGSMRKRDFEMLVGRSGGGFIPDPHDTLQGAAYNPDNSDEAQLTGQISWRSSWYEPEVNALIEQGLVENDRAKREAIYQEVQRVIDEKSSFEFPISQRLDPLAVHQRVQNYQGDPTWMVRWELVDKTD
jgi:peptide/nickel transport system substrate-binding protein